MASYEDFQKTLKEFQASQKKAKESGYLRIRLAGEYLVFPHALGLQVLAALDQAEKTNAPYSYSNPPTIRRLDSQDLEVTPLSHEEYQDIHVAQLLQLKQDEVREIRKSEGIPLPF